MASLEPMRFMLNGIFAVYKPRGWTSRKATDAVQVELSKLLWEKTNESQLSSAPYIKKKKMIKIGHGGTLVI
ncbi:uncharacterized protein BX663DRAFT_523008 [Cokeromyces recurvatus]|uniref:uncharacterized protein n=1 Tax=Cokeromyces recurvatus TaxID=90255 RepID=UPI00221EECA8|nr:uncharacterized protein BX663DRAFT_523008 [Cokeromyces recurvatus]KAI7899055.1 hypothetical protein BX663DRAFT_523008 [Cokeromyces recurvatus]